MDNSVKIKGKEKFFYGLGDLSANILLAAASFYLLFFMVSVGGLKPALASLVFLISKIWDAVTDVWMGRISDNTKSRFGKSSVMALPLQRRNVTVCQNDLLPDGVLPL